MLLPVDAGLSEGHASTYRNRQPAIEATKQIDGIPAVEKGARANTRIFNSTRSSQNYTSPGMSADSKTQLLG